MGRHKTITDDAVLTVAREIFRAKGHTATTREIAEAAGISEAVLYQRFGSKNELFFEAMRPRGPDIEQLLGPAEPPGDAREYLRATVARIGKYFAAVIPLALHVMTHPSFGPATLHQMQPGGPALLQEAFARRLDMLVRRGDIATPSTAATAQILVSLAHDWALGTVLPHGAGARGVGRLRDMVDVIWDGLRRE